MISRFSRRLRFPCRWLNDPQFVGSFEAEDYVYFLFRETAVEYINCGKVRRDRYRIVIRRDALASSIIRDTRGEPTARLAISSATRVRRIISRLRCRSKRATRRRFSSRRKNIISDVISVRAMFIIFSAYRRLKLPPRVSFNERFCIRLRDRTSITMKREVQLGFDAID